MANNNENKVLNVPNLRFPEFTEEWKETSLSSYAKKITKKNKGNIISNVLCNSANLGIIPQSDYFDRDIANNENTDAYYVIENGDFVYNPRKSVTAPYGPVNMYLGNKTGIISPLYLCFSVKDIYCDFLLHWFKGNAWHRYVYSHGDTGVRFDRVSIKDDIFLNMPIKVPVYEEQIRISKLLRAIDERIATQNKIIEDLKKLKSAIRKRVFSLLKDEHTESFEINQLLAYEQPTTYIVANDEYSTDTTLIPVLTANKGFVLGYTDEEFGVYQKGECIIFDDFTMDAKYVSFPFKVKSSAIKILTAKSCVNLRFMFEYLSYLELKSEEHKRHYISEIASLIIEIPLLKRQNEIAFLMTSLDNKLTLEENVKVRYEDEKQYLLSQMFI